MSEKPKRERAEVEQPAIKYAERRGWWHTKINSPTQNALPDDLFVRRGQHVWIEFKAEGETPDRQQTHRHEIMRAYGMDIRWTDNLEQARQWLK